MALGEHERAEVSFQKSTTIATRLVIEYPAIIRYKDLLYVRAWLMMAVVLAKQGKNDEAATAFTRGLAVQLQHLALLSNDAELAFLQGDIARFQTRIDAALSQLTPKDEPFIILRFFTWLANPGGGWADVMTAIGQLDPEVKFTRDFSLIKGAITRLDESTQQTAQQFMDFFEGHIDLPILQARLAAT